MILTVGTKEIKPHCNYDYKLVGLEKPIINLFIMKKLLLITALIYPFLLFSQTCIVAVKTKDKIIVGAESRVDYPIINTLTGETIHSPSDKACKIISFGDYNFALTTNLYSDELMALANKIISEGKSFDAIEISYTNKTRKLILGKLDSISKIFPGVLDTTRFKMNNQLLSFIFFGRERDSLRLDYFALTRSPNMQYAFYLQWGKVVPDTLALGDVKEIYDDKIISNKQTWEKGTYKGIGLIINYAHNLYPYNVGGPINIIEITRKKTKWVGGKKPPCY